MTFKRVFTIVLDSVGVGEAPDADKYGDVGANTVKHINEYYKGKLNIPNLKKLGLFKTNNLDESSDDEVIGLYGRMIEHSVGKDSMDGHWEMMGLPVMTELSTYPNGFPEDKLKQLEEFSGRKVIVNKPYSGTEVIKDYGEEHLKTGALIVYTSGDSVLQIAAHEEVVPLEELYKICEYARELFNDDDNLVGRIIARPFVGTNKDNFTRTSNRHDFSLKPMGVTDLDRLQKANVKVIGIGKINDIFSGMGITEGYHNLSNMDGMDHLDHVMKEDFEGFCFVNLVDFDAMYGHRRDCEGFGKALEDFDARLATVLENLKDDDLLMITADHGNDPGFKGTDHTREMVPLLVYSPAMSKPDKSLGVRDGFSDLGATILDNFGVTQGEFGTSFLNEIK